MASDVLTRADLNRAILARQMLLAREKITVVRAVERLAGLQAQLARPPFIGLWSRIAGFEAKDLARAVHDRKVVRATLLRGTLHLMTAEDYVALRPVLQPMLAAGMQGVLEDRAAGMDVERVLASARAALGGDKAMTFEDLRAVLSEAWPGIDERALGYAVRMHLPLVQVPMTRPGGGRAFPPSRSPTRGSVVRWGRARAPPPSSSAIWAHSVPRASRTRRPGRA